MLRLWMNRCRCVATKAGSSGFRELIKKSLPRWRIQVSGGARLSRASEQLSPWVRAIGDEDHHHLTVISAPMGRVPRLADEKKIISRKDRGALFATPQTTYDLASQQLPRLFPRAAVLYPRLGC